VPVLFPLPTFLREKEGERKGKGRGERESSIRRGKGRNSKKKKKCTLKTSWHDKSPCSQAALKKQEAIGLRLPNLVYKRTQNGTKSLTNN
jgi:hypothetical protein